MCGRYSSSREAPALVEVLTGLGIAVDQVDPGVATVPATYNMAPTRQGLVLAPDRGDGATRPGTRLAPLAWGLVPSWAADRRGAARMINARVETAAVKPAFRALVGTRRCLVPADGWFEWQRTAGGKRPYLVLAPPQEAPVLLLAGLYTWWRPKDAAEDHPWFGSYTILTTAARPDLAWLHDRMPVVVGPEHRADWLAVPPRGTAADPVATAALLADVAAASADPDRTPLTWHPVDPRVGSVANDDPGLLLPAG